jgi:hypothetical protein
MLPGPQITDSSGNYRFLISKRFVRSGSERFGLHTFSRQPVTSNVIPEGESFG